MEATGSGRSPSHAPSRPDFSRAPAREATRAELVEDNAHLRLLLSSVAQAVWETDPDGMVTVDSPSWRAYTGQTLEQWLGEGWSEAIHPDDRAAALEQWREAVRAHRPVDGVFRLRHASSGWRWTNVRAAPVFGVDGAVLKWVGLNIDVDERKRTEAGQRVAKARQDFLLRLSDELRSLDDPAELQGTACRLLGEHLRADRVHYAEIREDEGVAVVGPDYHTGGSPSLTGRYTLERFGDTPRLHGGLTVAVRDIAAATSLGEEARRTCLALGIAAFIAVPFVRDDEAVVTVTDTGVGIPTEHLQQVFDLFSQVRSHQGRAEGGLGIGLALVRRLVEMHGGTVTAQSEGTGRGTSFVVRLPCTVAPQPPAHDGAEAIEAALAMRPEVVILDLGMPGLDGFEAARRLRAMPECRDTLLIALTGWGQERDKQRTRDAGFAHHLVKPADPDALLDLLRELPPRD
jgi:PAS domain S-box-containing protein